MQLFYFQTFQKKV